MNPGRQSRFYLVGLVRAAQRLGLHVVPLELAPIWEHVNKASQKIDATLEVGRQLRGLVARERITHVLGYGSNGAELGQVFGHGVEPLFASLGLTHLMLWTDHPNWFLDGQSMRPEMARLLANPRHVHFVKSEIAAAECCAMLGWPRVHGLAMAEDYELLTPAAEVSPTHDVVAIIGAAWKPAAAAMKFIDADDPDPAEIDAGCAERATVALRTALDAQQCPDAERDGVMAWAGRVMEAKQSRPLDAVWRITREEGMQAPAWLTQDARRWYAVGAAIRMQGDWRRNFWLAWLARRRTLLLCGCDARMLTPDQPEFARGWVAYDQQAKVYGLGRCVINTNAAHDEEGCTHKPFQIAASGSACVHHATRGLEDLFASPNEVLTFTRGPELLEAVGAACLRRGDMAWAMRERAMRDHTWDKRLARMLALSSHAPA
ncbi:MAG: glycosyltransferase [Tepidisphaera sp.]|nr:glycosyltransferase [Tepidisphaera sp.]